MFPEGDDTISHVIIFVYLNGVDVRSSLYGIKLRGLNYKWKFRDISEVVKNLECACILWREDNYIHQTKMMGSVDHRRLFCLPVDNNYCSSYITYETNIPVSVIRILSCNTSIDDVEYNTPYLDVFIWSSCSMTE